METPDIHWERATPAAERAEVALALAHPGLVEVTLARLYSGRDFTPPPSRFAVRHLATGGAKRVYLVNVFAHPGGQYGFVLKLFLARQLVHLPPGVTLGGAFAQAVGLDNLLLERIVWAAQRVDEVAPCLCPRFGGFWEWTGEGGRLLRVMTEAYLEGHSLDGWKAILEDRFIRGELGFAEYTEQRRAMEQRAIAAYIRLWDALGRQTFTSDPSPWNVLFVPTPTGYRPSIIDLHSIHDGGTPLYVFQTLEEFFGSRDEIREHVLCPGILDGLGEEDGVRFLQTVRAELEALAELRSRSGLSSYAPSSRTITRFLLRSGSSGR